ncbi:MAG: hypothetical protein CSA21_02975 [Deltaproteobacteria bacterium]|nr:MAG: hypothetical protein CSA21_02975 [Deltaproteobacteria bacterium]
MGEGGVFVTKGSLVVEGYACLGQGSFEQFVGLGQGSALGCAQVRNEESEGVHDHGLREPVQEGIS